MDQRGPRHHGVTAHGRTVAGLLRQRGLTVLRSGAADVTHAQFTDALWGPDIDAAATAFEEWSATVPRPLVVTLHDLPGAGVDPGVDVDAGRAGRRRAGYGRVIAVSDVTVVSSHHEAAKARQLGGSSSEVTMIDLPMATVTRPGVASRAPASSASLTVLGFVYPGKGHTEVIDAASRRTPAPGVIAVGSVSSGHLELAQDLHRLASTRGVTLTIRGPLSERAFITAVEMATVPVVPARHVSASASLLRWVAQGRRPLCADGAYSREIDLRYPGLIRRYTDGRDLDRLVDSALEDPGSTRLSGPPRWPDVGLLHIETYARAVRRGTARVV